MQTQFIIHQIFFYLGIMFNKIFNFQKNLLWEFICNPSGNANNNVKELYLEYYPNLRHPENIMPILRERSTWLNAISAGTGLNKYFSNDGLNFQSPQECWIKSHLLSAYLSLSTDPLE